MPKGSPGVPRKTDAPETVARVRALYAANWTQIEIAHYLGWSLKKVQGVFRRNGITPRKPTPRNQRGPMNPRWKGDEAGYQAMHLRVYAERGKPVHCQVCQKPAHEWANLTGNYQDIEDYAPMCRSCHRRYDGTVKNLQR